MIKPSDKKIIIATIGNHYSGEIIEHLNKKKIYNTKGKPFSPDSIRAIVNGIDPNERVEKAIITYVVQKKARKAKTQKALSDKLRK